MKSPLLKSLLEMLKTYTDRPEYDNILGYAKDLGKHLNVPPSYLDWYYHIFLLCLFDFMNQKSFRYSIFV